jgi:hypothetical protein
MNSRIALVRRIVGWILLVLVWAGVGIRSIHWWGHAGDYKGLLGQAIEWIDKLLIMPPWHFLSPSHPKWLFLAGAAVWVIGISMAVYFLLIRKPEG